MSLHFEPAVLPMWNRLDTDTRAAIQRDLERIARAPRAGMGVLATSAVTVAFRVDRSTHALVVTHLSRDG